MKTKVTFSFEDQVIESASAYARKNHTSVRSLIRNFLDDLSNERRPSKQDELGRPDIPTGDSQ